MTYLLLPLIIIFISSVSILFSFLLYKLNAYLIFLPAIVLILLMSVSIILPSLNDYSIGSLAFALYFVFFLFSLIVNLIFSIIYFIKNKKSVV